jgi:alkylhydroperoxidase/carboxymuconolactone decarboxylase family protein YurZ
LFLPPPNASARLCNKWGKQAASKGGVFLKAGHAKAALSPGVSPQALMDAIAVGALFGIVTRYADALDFAMPTPQEFERAANMLLKRGYAL